MKRPRLTVTRRLKLTVPRSCIDRDMRIGMTMSWRIPAFFELSRSLSYQPQSISIPVRPATLIWANHELADLVIQLESRTYVRYRS